MNERKSAIYTPTRRDLLALFGAGFLAACARSPEVSPSPLTGVQRTESPTQTQKAEKTPDSVEQRIRAAGITTWMLLLNKEHKPERFQPTLKFRVLNPESLDKVRDQFLIPNAKPTDVPIKLSWFAQLGVGSNKQGYWGDKWLGETEFNNIKVQLQGAAPTDAASRANGIEWVGAVQFTFIERNRSALEYGTPGTAFKKEPFFKWYESESPYKALPDFSPWINGGWGIIVTQKNGQLQRESGTHFSGTFAGMELPTMSDAFKSCNPSYNCQRVPIDIK